MAKSCVIYGQITAMAKSIMAISETTHKNMELNPNMTEFTSQKNIAGMAKTMLAIFNFPPV